MAEKSNVLVFPESGNNGIDPSMLLAMNGNNGWGMNNPFWMIFMLPFLYPFFNMFGGYGNFGMMGGMGNMQMMQMQQMMMQMMQMMMQMQQMMMMHKV